MSRALIYPVEHRDYLFYVRGSVGATDAQPKVVRLLVDTGARRTVLPKQLLREFGCKLDDPERSIRVTAAGGGCREARNSSEGIIGSLKLVLGIIQPTDRPQPQPINRSPDRIHSKSESTIDRDYI